MTKRKSRKTRLLTIALLPIAMGVQGGYALAESTKTALEASTTSPAIHWSGDIDPSTYILGPGDGIYVEVIPIAELSGIVTVGPDGNIHLPRVRMVKAEGLTLEELRLSLTHKYREFIKEPDIEIQQLSYRPIKVYVTGEVQRPGSYVLTNSLSINPSLRSNALTRNSNIGKVTIPSAITTLDNNSVTTAINPSDLPTVFDAIRAAEGITPYSDLAKVTVTRKLPISEGNKRVRASLDFLKMIKTGDESDNIRLLDGDVITISKSNSVLLNQLLKAGRTNLNPKSLTVFVAGRVRIPGAIQVPQGAALNQALLVAGGPKLLKGKIEFVRFHPNGKFDRRLFSYSPRSPLDARNNPVLMAGDIIRIRDSPLSAAFTVLKEATTPAIGIFSIYQMLETFSE